MAAYAMAAARHFGHCCVDSGRRIARKQFGHEFDRAHLSIRDERDAPGFSRGSFHPEASDRFGSSQKFFPFTHVLNFSKFLLE